MAALTIKKGTLREWFRSEMNPDDIVFITDVPVIMSHGQVYGVPLWENEPENE